MQVKTTVALTGNLYLEHPVSGYKAPEFLKFVDYLRDADVTLTNLECAIQDGSDPPAFVSGAVASGTYMGAPPSMIDEMKFLGVDVACAGTNHASDFGDQGILRTIRYLRERGMPFSGIGASLTEATRACYVDTAAGRRVATISVCDWGPKGQLDLQMPWPMGHMPSDDRPPYRPRPGVSLLRYGAVTHVERRTFDELRRASAYLGWEEVKDLRRRGILRTDPLVGPRQIDWEVDTDNEFYFMGRKFVVAEGTPGSSTFAYEEDVLRILNEVREARRQADIVIVALHDQSHGTGVHDHVRLLAHQAMDAGADVFFCNAGCHRGVEIYKSKAIVYGQPGLYLQIDQITKFPSSAMDLWKLPPETTAGEFLAARQSYESQGGNSKMRGWETAPNVVHQLEFDDDNRLASVRIQPFATTKGPRFRSGLPIWADDDEAARVLARTVPASEGMGSKVVVEGGVGTIHVNPK